ncbi:MAG: putative repeat protein (TIGR01451 family) [Cocleimonas sp.]|jgi:uncharacterized repeat protein (TIGR01451 family)
MQSKLSSFGFLLLIGFLSAYSSLMAAQLLVGQQTYNSTFGSGGFTTVPLSPSFSSTPVVFVLPTTQGGDPSNVRVRNINASSFQAAPTEPHRQDGPHVAMQSTSISVDKGNYTLPDGTKFEVDTTSFSDQQFGTDNSGTSSWHQVFFNVAFNSAPIVVATIQTMNNEVGESGQLPPAVSSLPFIDVAIRNITTTGFEVSLERSEIADGAVVSPETVGYMAMEPATGSFVDSNNNSIVYKAYSYSGARGWDNNCVSSTFPGGVFSSTPVVMASKRTRNNPDGGWVRRCSLSNSQIGIKIDEDRETEGDNERGTTAAEAESISVIAFSSSFVLDFLPTYVPILEVSKQSETLSDPVNSTTNPKSIPGAIVEYEITVTNTGQGEADAGTFVLNDVIPSNTSLIVSGFSCGSAVSFIDGSPSSGLACGTVEFSQDGSNYSYSPTPVGPNNTDSSVRYIRIKPNNAFNASVSGSTPNVTFKFRVELN